MGSTFRRTHPPLPWAMTARRWRFAGAKTVKGEIEMDYRKAFEVAPGKKLRLSKIDPSHAGAHESHETAEPEIRRQVECIDKLQELLYADGDQSLLVVLQALDAAGKDGVIRHVFSGMNPQLVHYHRVA